jgi:hypothetical protein
MTQDEIIEAAIQGHASTRDAIRWAIKEALAQPEQETQAYREAAQLAKWLFKTHYAQEEHYAAGRVVWGLCDTTAGVISQIDNMVCKLVLHKELEQEPYPVEEIQEEILRLSEIISTNAFYQAGHADALEWAAEMAVLDDPRTSDWVYDDPHELAKALRKGPDFGPTTPPTQRKPLTHEQRVDLLAKFEAHKHEWHAPAILIDIVEVAHGIKGDA